MPVTLVEDDNAKDPRQKALFAAAKAPPRVYRLLSWMVNCTIANPKFATSALEIYIRFFKRLQVEPSSENWKQVVEEPLPKNWRTWRTKFAVLDSEDDDARVLMSTARKFLNKHNAAQARDALVLYLPVEKPGEGDPRCHYRLEFVTRAEWEEATKGTTKAPASPYGVRFSALHPLSRSLWTKLAEPINPREARLIYSNEQPELQGSATDTNEVKAMARDIYSGTGEVAAGLLLGLRTAHLQMPVELTPELSKETKGKEFSHNHLLMIVLGSMASNKAIATLRRLPPWSDLQTFYFKQKTQHSPVYICKKNDPSYSREQRRSDELDSEVEYALVSYFVNPERQQILIGLAGITTAGTRAAAEFLCLDEHVSNLISELNLDLSKPIPSFEVLLRVTVCDFCPTYIEVHDKQVHR